MQKTRRYTPFTDILTILTLAFCAGLLPTAAQAAETRTLRLLFIGNSFTQRGGMRAVKELAEAGSPGLRVEFIAYGGSGARLERHWQGGTQNLVSIAGMTAAERQAAVQSLRDALAKDPDDARAKAVLRQHGRLEQLGTEPGKWDYVALQSYGDDHGDAARYAEYAEKFAKVIKAQGGRPLLYETATGGIMNAKPLTAPPEPDAVLAKAKVIAALADRLDAAVAPMSLVALRCHTVRPDLTLAWVNDGHPNQTMGYLTACTFYAAMFERSPEGLPVDSATDIKAFGEGKDADGGPLMRTFSPKDRADLQRIAWEGYSQFQQLRKGEEQ